MARRPSRRGARARGRGGPSPTAFASSRCAEASACGPCCSRRPTRRARGKAARRGRAAGAALELFQTYLLTHDDWMDGDDVRRGGPSVPAMMRARFGAAQRRRDEHPRRGPRGRVGAARCSSRSALPPERVGRAAREFARVHEDVVAGQVLDVRGAARDARAVEAMHALKTASYTVRGSGRHRRRISRARRRSRIDGARGVRRAARASRSSFATTCSARSATRPRRASRRATICARASARRSSSTPCATTRAAEALDRVLGRRDATRRGRASGRSRASRRAARGPHRGAHRRARRRESRGCPRRGRGWPPAGRALLERAIDALTERER